MPARDREEAKEVSGRGDVGAYGAGLICVWYTDDVGLFVLECFRPQTTIGRWWNGTSGGRG